MKAHTNAASSELDTDLLVNQASESFLMNWRQGGCVDESCLLIDSVRGLNATRYLQDQLIIFMALARGQSRILAGPLSLHTKTAIHVAESFMKVRCLDDSFAPS